MQPWTYTGNKAHPTEKAVDVIAPLIKSFSEPGDVVLGPFSGSGSTAVAAVLNHRQYVGIELDKGYCAHAEKRLAEVKQKLETPRPQELTLYSDLEARGMIARL